MQATPRAASRERAAELRRLALQLLQRGHEVEAGLLDNYAVLLERSNVSRERVNAEVARLLKEADTELGPRRHKGRFGSFRVPMPEPRVETPRVGVIERLTVPRPADTRRRAGR